VYDASMRRRRLVLGLAFGVAALARPVPLRAADDPFAALAVRRVTPPVGPREFTVPTPPGRRPASVSLQGFRGHVVFLNFWATWCPPCREEMPAMERLYQRYRDRGLVVLALSVDADGAAVVTPFLTEHRLTFPVGLDPDMRVAGLYGIRALPSTFLLNRAGRVVASAVGPREWDGPEGRAVVERVLAGP